MDIPHDIGFGWLTSGLLFGKARRGGVVVMRLPVSAAVLITRPPQLFFPIGTPGMDVVREPWENGCQVSRLSQLLAGRPPFWTPRSAIYP